MLGIWVVWPRETQLLLLVTGCTVGPVVETGHLQMALLHCWPGQYSAFNHSFRTPPLCTFSRFSLTQDWNGHLLLWVCRESSLHFHLENFNKLVFGVSPTRLWTSCHVSFKKICSLFLFGCVGCSLLRGLFSSCSVQASRCGFSCCKAWAPGRTGFGSCGSQALEHRPSSCPAWA